MTSCATARITSYNVCYTKLLRFDSIAGTPAEKPKLEVVEAKANDGADSDDLQDLFDAVASEFEAAHEPASAPAPSVASDTASVVEAMTAEAEHSCDAVYQKIGQMTRRVHNALSELGYDQALHDAAEVMPDARQRLNYIAQMTEQAASKVSYNFV